MFSRTRKPKICYISKLPNQILKVIFCKLPVISLLKCRHVCQLWQQILSHPDFTRHDLLTRTPTTLLICADQDKFRWIEFEGVKLQHQVAATVRSPFPLNCVFQIINSCNGLACVYQVGVSVALHIINPITSEHMTLSVPENERMLYSRLCGLGFDCKTNKFKMLRFSCLYNKFHEDSPFKDLQLRAEICTLGNDQMTWKRVAGIPPKYGNYMLDFHRPFFQGSLHYCLGNQQSGQVSICAFDFQKEKFKSIPLPPSFHQEGGNNNNITRNIGAFRDHYLTFFYSTRVNTCMDGDTFHIWLMKEYGAVESWIKKFVIKKSNLMLANTRILDNGDLLLYNFNRFLLYSVEKNAYITLRAPGRHEAVYPMILHNPCFASLKDLVGVGSKLTIAKRDVTNWMSSLIMPTLLLVMFHCIWNIIFVDSVYF